jgi:soluble lytic murein transglycosylase
MSRPASRRRSGPSRARPQSRSRGRAPARRSAPRRASRGRRRRPRRGGAKSLALAAALALVVGYGLAKINLGETIRELTLPLRYDNIIRQQADDKGVDADLIAAVIYAESRFRDQTSHAGARGLMQITPDTAETIEKLSGGETFEYEDLADPDLNIRYGTFFLAHLLEVFEGNEVAALAGYNAGMAHAHRWGGAGMEADDIEFPETRDYVEEVLTKRREYRENYGDQLGL